MRIVKKPWGKEIWVALTSRYVGKILIINKGERFSKQYHRTKDETLYCDSGKFVMELGRKKLLVKPGQAVRVKPGVIHRIEAKYGKVKIFEVSTPQLHDRIRIEDDYGRSK
jgi:mannose-6-phosphate isomerase-like protein (cupin superfamily)